MYLYQIQRLMVITSGLLRKGLSYMGSGVSTAADIMIMQLQFRLQINIYEYMYIA
jgi:hypothetical protein